MNFNIDPLKEAYERQQVIEAQRKQEADAQRKVEAKAEANKLRKALGLLGLDTPELDTPLLHLDDYACAIRLCDYREGRTYISKNRNDIYGVAFVLEVKGAVRGNSLYVRAGHFSYDAPADWLSFDRDWTDTAAELYNAIMTVNDPVPDKPKAQEPQTLPPSAAESLTDALAEYIRQIIEE